jgi:hypothetical protein
VCPGSTVGAGAGEEGDAVGLDEGEQCQACGERHDADRDRHRHGDHPVVRPATVDDRLQQGPLGHEPGGHRQGGGTQGADAERRRGDRHPRHEPTHPVQVALAGGVQHRAGAEEHRRLERGMAGDQEQAGEESGVAGRRRLVGAQHQGSAQGQEDQADVLRRRVAQQLLEVAGDRCLQDAVDRGDGPETDDDGAPPAGSVGHQPDRDQQHAEHAHLDHGRAHHRGHVAGCRRVSTREPHMHRHDARLGGEPGQQQQERHRRGP